MKTTIAALALAGLMAGGAAAPMAAAAEGDSPWQVRLRGIWVAPDESADISVIGGDVDIDNAFVPELDITYFVTDNIALELILATAPHDVEHSTGADLGSVWLLPPTLTAQYHFAPKSDTFRPYLGVGINYTFFYNVDDPAGLNIDYDNSFGFALQAGFDIPLGNGWLFNVDVKKLYLSTDVRIAPLGVTADVDIDPWIVGVGFGYRY